MPRTLLDGLRYMPLLITVICKLSNYCLDMAPFHRHRVGFFKVPQSRQKSRAIKTLSCSSDRLRQEIQEAPPSPRSNSICCAPLTIWTGEASQEACGKLRENLLITIVMGDSRGPPSKGSGWSYPDSPWDTNPRKRLNSLQNGWSTKKNRLSRN